MDLAHPIHCQQLVLVSNKSTYHVLASWSSLVPLLVCLFLALLSLELWLVLALWSSVPSLVLASWFLELWLVLVPWSLVLSLLALAFPIQIDLLLVFLSDLQSL